MLALRLKKTVSELLRDCDSYELSEWMAMLRLESDDMKGKKAEPKQDINEQLKHAFGNAGASASAKKKKPRRTIS